MSNYRISDLTNYTNPDAANDVIEIVDFANNANKKITRNNLLGLTSAPVSINDIQTLTQKTLTAPTISSPILSGTITGTYTLAGTPTFPASVATLTGSQTLTNKILTSPTINAPTITNASITADAITGFSSANTGTIYGMAVTAGAISGASLTAGTVGGTQLSTSAITLGYAQTIANFTTASATAVQVTGLTATVTIPAGGRKIKITAYCRDMFSSSLGTFQMTIWDGTVGSGTQLVAALINSSGTSTSLSIPVLAMAIITPAAGAKTYNVGLQTSAGTAQIEAAATYPAFILVEAI